MHDEEATAESGAPPLPCPIEIFCVPALVDEPRPARRATVEAATGDNWTLRLPGRDPLHGDGDTAFLTVLRMILGAGP